VLFCIDLGNTNVTLGLYEANDLRAHWRIMTDHHRMPDEYGILMIDLLSHAGFKPGDVTGICLCSVVPPLTGVLDESCRTYFGQAPLIIDASVKTGLTIRYDNPREVGADRVVDAVAVYRLYGAPACIVDFGTATTFDAISREGDYLGGAIAPGIGIAAEALFSRTAQLPRIDLVRPPGPIGRNTVHSMQSGLLFGYVGLVEGMVARFRKELGDDTRVVGTGGLVEIIARETNVIQEIDPWLTLRGLRILWDLNRPAKSVPDGP
jgi:type III pantothenate kinase